MTKFERAGIRARSYSTPKVSLRRPPFGPPGRRGSVLPRGRVARMESSRFAVEAELIVVEPLWRPTAWRRTASGCRCGSRSRRRHSSSNRSRSASEGATMIARASEPLRSGTGTRLAAWGVLSPGHGETQRKSAPRPSARNCNTKSCCQISRRALPHTGADAFELGGGIAPFTPPPLVDEHF